MGKKFTLSFGVRHVLLCAVLVHVSHDQGDAGSAPALNVELLPMEQTIIGDGRTTYSFSLLILDSRGHLVPANDVSIVTDKNVPLASAQIQSGFYSFEYTPPRVSGPSRAKFHINVKRGDDSLSNEHVIKIFPENPLTITVTAHPPTVFLGKDKTCQIRIEIKDTEGKAVPHASMTFEPTAGSVADVRDLGNGSYSAVFLPPKEKYPQVSIITVRAEHGDISSAAFLSLPLVGTTTLPVETKPKTKVTVTIGTKEWGPFDSGLTGKFDVPVIVPPGFKTARAVATDEFKNVTQKEIDLHVPPSQRLKLMADPQAVVADGRARARLKVFVVDDSGRPQNGAEVTVRSTQGSIERTDGGAPGVNSYDFISPPRSAGDSVTITATLSDRDTMTDVKTIRLMEGHYPASLQVNLDPRVLVADGQSQAVIRIHIADAAGNGARGKEVRLESDRGFPGPVKEVGNGNYVAVLKSPKGVGGRHTAAIEASLVVKIAPAGGPAAPPGKETRYVLTGTGTLALTSGTPRKASLSASPGTLQADGESTSRILVRLYDEYGNPIVGEPLILASTRGKLGSPEDHGDGTYTVAYVSSRESERTHSVISVTNAAGNFQESTSVALVPKPKNFSIGPKAGYQTNFAKINAPSFSVEGGYRMPLLDHNIFAVCEAGYYAVKGSSNDRNSSIGNYSISYDLRVVSLDLTIVYKISALFRFTPYVGVGAGARIVLSRVSASFQPALEESEQILGLHGLGGGEFALGPGTILTEAKYAYAPMGSDTSIRGNIGGLSVNLGYRYLF